MPTQVMIVTLTGDRIPFQIPETGTIDQLIPILLRKLGMSGGSGDYDLVYGGQALSREMTLRSLEIPNRAELLLKAKLVPDSASRDHYLAQANARYPALIIFLIDVSGSMNLPLGDRTRIQVVEEAFEGIVAEMTHRSRKGEEMIAPRYRIALFTYADKPNDLYRGIQTIDRVANIKWPKIEVNYTTNTAAAFTEARNLLRRELPGCQVGIGGSKNETYPAPLVCHLTDGEYTQSHGDPEPIVREIMAMRVPDGHVLVENIFISDRLIEEQIDVNDWPGFDFTSRFPNNPYAQKLLDISSPVPKSYLEKMPKGSKIRPGTAMFYPGVSKGFIKLAFQMSCSTPTARK